MFQMENHGLFLDTEILKKGNSVLSDSLSVFGSKFRVGRGDRLIIRNLVTSKKKTPTKQKKDIYSQIHENPNREGGGLLNL